jgi:hypothetical protein
MLATREQKAANENQLKIHQLKYLRIEMDSTQFQKVTDVFLEILEKEVVNTIQLSCLVLVAGVFSLSGHS